MEHCPNQKMIDQLQKTVISGNGEPSLVAIINKMSTKLDTYMDRQEDLIKEFNITNKEFYQFKTAAEATIKEQERQQGKRNRNISIMVTVLIALFTVSVAWIRDNQKQIKQNQAILESRQNYDSYDLMVIMDSLNFKVGTRGIDSLEHF